MPNDVIELAAPHSQCMRCLSHIPLLFDQHLLDERRPESTRLDI
jgi:hypothetical protein